MPLMGKRVLLRALESRDLDLIWEAYRDFELELITSGDAPPVSDHQVRAFWLDRIDHPAANMRYFVIEPQAGHPGAGHFAGMCNLHDIDMRNRHAELALWLASPELRGHGYGTDAIRVLLAYAFEVVRLDKVYLGAYDFNEAGLRCYERIGFRYEGCLKQQIFYQGRYWDEWPMRILRCEWEHISQPPVDGLRPYHPDDLEPALHLLRSQCALPDESAARARLRRWWRRIDCTLYSLQLGGQLAGLVVLTDETGAVQESVAFAAHKQTLATYLGHLPSTFQPHPRCAGF